MQWSKGKGKELLLQKLSEVRQLQVEGMSRDRNK